MTQTLEIQAGPAELARQANLCRWRRVPENFTVPRAFESTIVQENVRVKFEDSVHSNKRGGLDA